MADGKLAKAITERFNEARKRAGLRTIHQVVQATGLQDKQVRRYFDANDKNVPKVPALMAMAEACGVTLDWLVEGRDDTPSAFFDWVTEKKIDAKTAEKLRGVPIYGRRVGADFYERARAALDEGHPIEVVVQMAHTSTRPDETPSSVRRAGGRHGKAGG
jgi:transcriptional regulator with XRE-family HTH domain